MKVLIDGRPALIVGRWSDFDDAGFNLIMLDDGSQRWISDSGARVRMEEST